MVGAGTGMRTGAGLWADAGMRAGVRGGVRARWTRSGAVGRGGRCGALAVAIARACLLRAERSTSSFCRFRCPRPAGIAGTMRRPRGASSASTDDPIAVVLRYPAFLAAKSTYASTPTPMAAIVAATPAAKPPTEASLTAPCARRPSISTEAIRSVVEVSPRSHSVASELMPVREIVPLLALPVSIGVRRSGDRLAWVKVVVLRERFC